MIPELILLFPQNHGLFESAFRPVMAFLETVGRDNTTTVSRMTKTMKDEHVVAMGLDYDTETRLRLALEKTTQAVLIEVRGRLTQHTLKNLLKYHDDETIWITPRFVCHDSSRKVNLFRFGNWMLTLKSGRV
jgi:hypothetical protein